MNRTSCEPDRVRNPSRSCQWASPGRSAPMTARASSRGTSRRAPKPPGETLGGVTVGGRSAPRSRPRRSPVPPPPRRRRWHGAAAPQEERVPSGALGDSGQLVTGEVEPGVRRLYESLDRCRLERPEPHGQRAGPARRVDSRRHRRGVSSTTPIPRPDPRCHLAQDPSGCLVHPVDVLHDDQPGPARTRTRRAETVRSSRRRERHRRVRPSRASGGARGRVPRRSGAATGRAPAPPRPSPRSAAARFPEHLRQRGRVPPAAAAGSRGTAWTPHTPGRRRPGRGSRRLS